MKLLLAPDEPDQTVGEPSTVVVAAAVVLEEEELLLRENQSLDSGICI